MPPLVARGDLRRSEMVAMGDLRVPQGLADRSDGVARSASVSAARERPGRMAQVGSATLLVPERFLTSHEVAARLGLHVKTVLRYVRCAGLPACRLPGGDLRYAWPEVSRWLSERKEAST